MIRNLKEQLEKLEKAGAAINCIDISIEIPTPLSSVEFKVKPIDSKMFTHYRQAICDDMFSTLRQFSKKFPKLDHAFFINDKLQNVGSAQEMIESAINAAVPFCTPGWNG